MKRDMNCLITIIRILIYIRATDSMLTPFLNELKDSNKQVHPVDELVDILRELASKTENWQDIIDEPYG